VSSSVPPSGSGPFGLDPAVAGAGFCVLAALGYTAANICLRQLAALGCDPMWAVCNKEMVAVWVAGPWLLVQLLRGTIRRPPPRTLGMLVLVGLAVQLGGNVGVQWALGVIGLALVIPVNVGTMLVSSALLGRLLLGERLSLRSVAAMGLLVVAVGLLGQGAGASAPVAQSAVTAHWGIVCVALACIAGVIYALFSIAIRHCVTGGTHMTIVVLVVTATGGLTLGPLSLARLGVGPLLGTPWLHLAWMLAAGVCNLAGFLAIARALQLTTVVHANMMNSSQVALAAVAGIVLFGERANVWLVSGVLLTIVGILMIGRPTSQEVVVEGV
jgi:drug/metabolite transporter (DMT)-like permease